MRRAGTAGLMSAGGGNYGPMNLTQPISRARLPRGPGSVILLTHVNARDSRPSRIARGHGAAANTTQPAPRRHLRCRDGDARNGGAALLHVLLTGLGNR